MTTEELHKILDDKDRKLSVDELKQVIYELKRDCSYLCLSNLDEYHIKEEEKFLKQYVYYNGEQNAFQIALDLLEHLDCDTKSDLEKRVKALEDYNEERRKAEIERLINENNYLRFQIKGLGL